jgi:quinol monooxygenase YgiN
VVRAVLFVTVKHGRGDELVRVWQTIAGAVRATPGCVRQTLVREPGESASFAIMSDWTSREAFGRFERSPEQDELTAPIRALRESARMVVYDLIVNVEGEDADARTNDGVRDDQAG